MALFPWGKSRQRAKGRGSLSLTEARLERGEVLLGDLHELKTTIAEARYENDFNNAKATFMRQEFEVVAAHLEEIRETYAGAQMRTLSRDAKAKGLPRKEARLLTDKQTAVRDILRRFDAVIQGLHLKADIEAQRLGIPRKGPPREATPSELPPGVCPELRSSPRRCCADESGRQVLLCSAREYDGRRQAGHLVCPPNRRIADLVDHG